MNRQTTDLWFETSYDFYEAEEYLRQSGIISYQDPGLYILLKDARSDAMGFGFYDPELAVLAKMAIGDKLYENRA